MATQLNDGKNILTKGKKNMIKLTFQMLLCVAVLGCYIALMQSEQLKAIKDDIQVLSEQIERIEDFFFNTEVPIDMRINSDFQIANINEIKKQIVNERKLKYENEGK